MREPRIFSMTFGSVYPHYVTKALNKERSEVEVLEIITWLTGYSKDEIIKASKNEVSFRDFFDQAPRMNTKRELIKGSVCGIKVQEVSDPLMKKIRQLDKLVDLLAKGKPMEKILPL